MNKIIILVEHDLLARVRAEWEQRADVLVEKLYAAGKIKEKHSDKDFFTRLIHVHKEFPGVSVLLHKDTATVGEANKELWSHPKILDALEQIIGSGIGLSKVTLFVHFFTLYEFNRGCRPPELEHPGEASQARNRSGRLASGLIWQSEADLDLSNRRLSSGQCLLR